TRSKARTSRTGGRPSRTRRKAVRAGARRCGTSGPSATRRRSPWSKHRRRPPGTRARKRLRSRGRQEARPSWLLRPPLLLRIRPERGELARPKRFDLLDPRAQRMERLEPKAVDAHARIVALMLLLHEARGPEDAQVAAHRRSAHLERVGELAGA